MRTLPKLDYWKRYKELGGNKAFEEFKNVLIDEINALNVDGMPKLAKLNALVGKYVNLEYRLPNGNTVKFWTITQHISAISLNVSSAVTDILALLQIPILS